MGLDHGPHLGQRADDLRLGGCRQPLAFVQRQADCFRDREIVALDPSQLGPGHDARP